MAIYYSKEKVSEIVKEYGGSEKNTGSVIAQVALMSYRIQKLSEHLHQNNKDQSCRRALLSLVGKRKKTLKYIQRKDINQYRSLIEKLGIRK